MIGRERVQIGFEEQLAGGVYASALGLDGDKHGIDQGQHVGVSDLTFWSPAPSRDLQFWAITIMSMHREEG